MHIDSKVSPVFCAKLPQTGSFFSCVRLIGFIVVSAKMIRWKICWIKLLKRSWEEIGISAQVWFEAFNGPCLAEFKQWPSGQMMMNLVPIFRSLRLGARHAYKCVYPEKFKFGHYYSSFHESVWISALFIKADLHKQKTKCWYVYMWASRMKRFPSLCTPFQNYIQGQKISRRAYI